MGKENFAIFARERATKWRGKAPQLSIKTLPSSTASSNKIYQINFLPNLYPLPNQSQNVPPFQKIKLTNGSNAENADSSPLPAAKDDLLGLIPVGEEEKVPPLGCIAAGVGTSSADPADATGLNGLLSAVLCRILLLALLLLLLPRCGAMPTPPPAMGGGAGVAAPPGDTGSRPGADEVWKVLELLPSPQRRRDVSWAFRTPLCSS